MADEGVVHLRSVPPVRIEPDGLVLAQFLDCGAEVKCIQGPVGSGKSFVTWQAAMVNALLVQEPHKGVRYRRTLVIRNTRKQLLETTWKTKALVLDPGVWGEGTTSGTVRHHIRMPGVDWEIIGWGADNPGDAERDFKSLELSDVIINEARYVPREVITTAIERLGRYPPSEWSGGCTSPQAILDTNAPMVGSWLSVVSGQSPMPMGLSADERLAWRPWKDIGWKYYVQPPAVLDRRDASGQVIGYRANPAAENLRYLKDGVQFYEKKIAGRTRAEVDSELGNKPGQRTAGKAVWPTFREEVHGADGLEVVPGHPLLVGVDFGRTPAAVIGQHPWGSWRVLRELVTENMGAREFARLLKGAMAGWFPDMDYAVWGDPAGEDMTQADDNSPMLAMRAEGIAVLPAPTGPIRNDWIVRRDAVAELLGRMTDGAPSFRVERQNCPTLLTGMAGQFAYPRLQTNDERYGDRPLKNRFSHVCDALQYLVLGGGEGRVLFQRSAMGRAVMPARVVHAPSWRGRGWGARR